MTFDEPFYIGADVNIYDYQKESGILLWSAYNIEKQKLDIDLCELVKIHTAALARIDSKEEAQKYALAAIATGKIKPLLVPVSNNRWLVRMWDIK